jgi:hypothetical protein
MTMISPTYSGSNPSGTEWIVSYNNILFYLLQHDRRIWWLGIIYITLSINECGFS